MFGSWLDDYERAARLLPGLLAVAPVAVAIAAIGLPVAPWTAGIGSLVALVAPAVLTKYVRNRGAALEDRLFDSWGAPPTTRLLQPSSGGWDAIRDARRANVEAATGLRLPRSDHPRDRQSYHAAVLALRAKTEDSTRFRRLHAENKNYGFERNLLGIRTEGLALSAVGLLGVFAAGIAAVLWNTPWETVTLSVGFMLDALMLAFWVWWPTEHRVLLAAERYAARLVDAAAELT